VRYCKAKCNCRCSGDVNNFFDSAELQWKYVCGVCTNGAPSVMCVTFSFSEKS